MGVHRQRRDLKIAQGQTADLTVLPVEVLPAQQHLHQRVMSEASGRLEPFHQHLERHILVLVGGEAASAHLGQQLGKGGVTGQVYPQHQGVDEKAHQLVQRGVAASGDRESHGDVAAGAELGQQHRHGGLHQHEVGRVVLTGHLGNPLLQFGAPLNRHGGAALIGDRRVGPIGGQLQVLGHAGQGILPVAELPGDAAAAVRQVPELRALPQRVVDVLHRQIGPVGGPPRAPAGISNPQIGHQRGHRPAVRSDVVRHGHQHVFIVGDAEKPRPHGDLGRQVEWATDLGVDGLTQPAVRPSGAINESPTEIRALGGHHHLPRYPLNRREQRAQALLALHHIGQRRAQCVGIEVPGQPQRHRQVVGRRRALELVDEPQPALGKRQRDNVGPPSFFQGHQRHPPALMLTDVECQLGNRGRLEHDAHRKAGIHGGVDRGDQAHRGQRIPTQVEERVIRAHPLHTQQPGINAGQDLLGERGRGAVPAGVLVLRCRQRPSVEFAVHRQWQRIDHHHGRRHHVRRQPVGQRGTYLGRLGGPGHIPHEALVAGLVFAGDHHRLVHPVQPGQRRLDFTELDTVPADLDLFIGAAEILQLPIGAPLHQVPGAVHAFSRNAKRTGHKPRCGQTGPADISDGHAAAGHIQLTDHARRHRPQPLVEDEQRHGRRRRTDGCRTRADGQRGTHRRIHRGLGGAVGVDHHPPGRPLIHHLGRASLAAEQQRHRFQPLRAQCCDRRRGLGEHVDPFTDQQVVEVVW